MRTVLFILGIIGCLALGLFIWGFIADKQRSEEIKPYVTYTRLVFVAEGCDKYYKTNGVWPNSLETLHAFRIDLNDPWTKDAWGRDVILVPYNVSLGYGEILSLGRDGQPGGSGVDRDLVVRFPTEPNAVWNNQQGEGLKKLERAP
jgi:hypothetical protein